MLALWSITFFSSALLKLIDVTSVQKVVTLKSNNELKPYQAYLANLSCSTVFFTSLIESFFSELNQNNQNLSFYL